MSEAKHGDALAETETEQAMLRATIIQSGEMIAQAERLIACSRKDAAAAKSRPANPAS